MAGSMFMELGIDRHSLVVQPSMHSDFLILVLIGDKIFDEVNSVCVSSYLQPS